MSKPYFSGVSQEFGQKIANSGLETFFFAFYDLECFCFITLKGFHFRMRLVTAAQAFNFSV